MSKGNISPIMTGRDFDILVLRTLVIDGECFIRKVKDNSKFGIHYELIDTMDIPHRFNSLNYDASGNRIIMGIKVDENYKPISYFINKNHGDYYNTSTAKEEVPAEEIIHIFRPYFVNQVRGYTMLSSVILNLNQLDGYTEAEVIGSRLAACNQAFITQTTADGDLLEEANSKGELIQDYAPGTIRYLPQGYDIKAFNSTHPNTNYGSFVKSVLRSISNALGISYNKATSDYESVNYSSLR
jgi:lambda family phage portal protein